MKQSNVLTRLFIFFAILVMINLISNRIFFRADFTEDKRYTLSSATENMLEDLNDVIVVKAYFTEGLPVRLQSTRKDLENMLIEYEKLSRENILYEFINPNESQEMESEAQQQGISPIIINITKSDQVQQMRAYMGAILQMGDKSEVIPVVQPGSSMEYDLTTSIKKLTLVDKPKLGLIQGHGEPSTNGLAQLAQQLSILYDIEPYTITDSTEIPLYFKVLTLIHPTDTISRNDFDKIDRYLESNGKLFVAYSHVGGNVNRGVLSISPNIGLSTWLTTKGIVLESQFIIDANSASIGVQQQQGPFVFNTQVKFPYFPIISDFADHPASHGLESLLLPFVCPITVTADSSVSTTILARTSENSGLLNPPVYIDINKQWTLNDFRDAEQPVAVALSSNVVGHDSRMIVVANGSFAVNGEGQSRQEVNPDNINFVSNCIDWLSDDTGLIDLRTKGITNRPIKQLEVGEKTLIKYANVLTPIILILIYAFIRKQRYMRKKQNWLQGNY